MPTTTLCSRLRPAASVVVAAVALLALAATANAQANFENPTDGSPQSGIGMFSGWVCNANAVTIEVDGTTVIEAAYGTPRGDTQAICGDANNGFGVLFNFNLFGDGEHTAVAKADGVPFGTHKFTVTRPTAGPFATGLIAEYTVPFPPGKTVNLIWQQGTQSFTIAPSGGTTSTASTTSGGAATSASTLGAFENPAAGSFVSGVIVFSGWLCDAQSVEIVIDGEVRMTPAYGTGRADTVAACGDANNGFGVLFNANLLGDGEHTAELVVDGMTFATRTFRVTVPTDKPFATGLEASFRLPGFPDAANDVTVEWQTGLQGFTIAGKQPTAGPTPTPGPSGTPGATATPAATATPGPTPTPGPTQTPKPIITPKPSVTTNPTPTPNDGLCGNGIVDGEDEECDGQDGLEDVTCEDLYSFTYQCLGEVKCTSDCKYDGRACECPCNEDFDCDIPLFHEIDCTPQYCSVAQCDPEDAEDCECIVDYGSCVEGYCLTTPINPAILDTFCNGLQDEWSTIPDDEKYPRCDYCFYE